MVALSDREAAVAELVMLGHRAAEIATHFGLTEYTVRSYIFRLCQGLQLRSMAELSIWVMQNLDAVAADRTLRKPGRCGLHAANCGCGSPYCTMRARLLRKVAA